MVVSGQRAEDQKNIIIEDNTFLKTPCTEVLLSQIDGCVVKNNTFGLSRENADYPIIAQLSGNRLRLEGNIFHSDCVPFAATREEN